MDNLNLQAIIEDYFSITGRPIATLTVEEYAKFLEIVNRTAVVRPAFSTYSPPVHNESSISANEKDSDNFMPEELQNPMVVIKNTKTISTQANKSKPKPSKEEMMKMLRSVSS